MKDPDKINLKEKFSQFSDHWNPRVIAELNGQEVKLVKFKGEFPWHKHDNEDEMFFVVNGSFEMQFRDRNVILEKNECIVVPKGVEHRPVAENEVEIMLFEPAGTLNTGDKNNDFTRVNPERI